METKKRKLIVEGEKSEKFEKTTEAKEKETFFNNEKDLLDLSTITLSQDFRKNLELKKITTEVPVRRPHSQEFIQVHPDSKYCLETAVLELKIERETWLVEPSLWGLLPNEIVPKILYATINLQNVIFLWPIRMPSLDGRLDKWNDSAHTIVDVAKKTWVKVVSNKSLGAYEYYKAESEISPPKWPDISFQELVSRAFKGKYIRDINHPILKQLRGQI